MSKRILSAVTAVIMILLLLPNYSLANTDKVNTRITSHIKYTSDEPRKITSRAELEQYIQVDAYYEDWLDRTYPETFFKDKFLYIRYIERANDMASYEVTSVNETASDVEIEVRRTAKGNGDMYNGWCLLAEADNSLLDKDFDVSFKQCLYSIDYFDGKPQSADEQNYTIINTLDELRNSWSSEEVLDKYAQTDFTKKSLIIVSWDEPQQVRATAVSNVTLSDSGSKITLSRCFPDGEVFPDVISAYSAVICVPKLFVKNEPSVVFKQYDEQNANDISVKSIDRNNLWGFEVVAGVQNLSEKAYLIVVSYDGGDICDISKKQINSDGEFRIVTYDTRHTTDKIRVFMWDSINGMRPLCGAEEVDL